jgi:hypothetical protein
MSDLFSVNAPSEIHAVPMVQSALPDSFHLNILEENFDGTEA